MCGCLCPQPVLRLCAGEVLALGHSKEAELLPAPAVIGEAVILKDQLPAAAFRPCTFRQASAANFLGHTVHVSCGTACEAAAPYVPCPARALI